MKKDVGSKSPILAVNRLCVGFPGKQKMKMVLSGVTFSLYPGEIHGLVGESGSGKSLFARTLVRLEDPAAVISGSINIKSVEITGNISKDIRRMRGKTVSLVLQDPITAMDPVFTIKNQLKDALYAGAGPRIPIKDVYALMEQAGIASPYEKCRLYPHEWSRGMLQRAQLVMAMLASPDILILDEVTSALDPTITLSIIELIRKMRDEKGAAVILITHDIDMAAYACDRISVMKNGTIVESNTARALFTDPEHPYTRMLATESRGV